MPVELGYFVVTVRDLERAQRFFGALMGWTYSNDHGHANYAHVANTKLPMGLFVGEPARLEALSFRVDDLDAMLKRVVELGGSYRDAYDSQSGRGAVCRDDQDTEFSLWQPAPGY
ncbi:MAG TPA: VOC family protein [Tahibacter sp.]|nr:VOC family protein [Tahibacter sp.]